MGALVLVFALVAACGITQASACTSLYVGSDLTENGSTYFGRGEDIGEHWAKVFQVIEAADHEEGEMYEDAYGFAMPYPAHTYRYTYVRDSLEYGENIVDDEGNVLIPAYAQAGINELGVSVTATVSTIYDNEFLDQYDAPEDYGICEISIAGVILQSATSAREGVQILADVLDEYGAGDDYGYYNSILIGDTEEVWNFQIVSAHNYVAVRLPADKVSINPNIVVIGNVDVSDTENVVASPNLITLAEENNFLVSPEENVINIRETYGTDDGWGQYTRYYQGVYYLNGSKLDILTLDEDGKLASADVGGSISYLFDTNRQLSTMEVLRFFATRGEGTEYDSNVDDSIWPIGNEHQAEVHVFEVRHDSELPVELATVEWLALNRSEYSIFLPFYSALLTETADVYHCDWTNDDGENWEYYAPADDYELFGDLVNDPTELPEKSLFWTLAAINDLCDNDRENYGANVKAFWESYQQALIEQQAVVDEAMAKIYAEEGVERASEVATEVGKQIAEEAYGYAERILTELWDFIQSGEEGQFTPSVQGSLPTYANMIANYVNDEEPVNEPSGETTEPSNEQVVNEVEPTVESNGPKADNQNTWPVIVAILIVVAVAVAVVIVIKRKTKN